MWRWLRFRWYRLRWWFQGTFHAPLSFPTHIDIELTSECNLHCVFCPHDFGFKNKGTMPLERAQEALRQALRYGAMSLKPNFRGEPALSPHLVDIVGQAKKGGMVDVFMNTNGIPYTKGKIEALKAAGMDRVKISIDGATRKTYESIRLGDDPNRWTKLQRNLKYFSELGPKLELQMTVNDTNRHEADQLKDAFPDIPVTINKERAIGTERRWCPQPFRRMIVAHDGVVYGCCGSWWDQFPVGHLDDDNLKDIWKGERMQQLRQHAKCGTGPCEKCDIREAWRS